MAIESALGRLMQGPEFSGRQKVLRTLPARSSEGAAPALPLPAALQAALESVDVTELFSHQAAAVDSVRAGKSTLIVTGTASGKTLCYHLPVLETCLADRESRALYLYPTKALARDQLSGLTRLIQGLGSHGEGLLADVFDGDTPTARRRTIKDRASIVLSNPDMLHVSILPQHGKWSRFLGKLRYVVVDEAHMYRGIFGAHVANVLRRLKRVCEHYGGKPIFIATSATVGNPAELGRQLFDEPVEVIEQNGAPRGPRQVLMWNPPIADDQTGLRKSASDETVRLLKALLREDCRTIVFTRTRQAAELIYRWTQEELERESPKLKDLVKAYRGGYLPEERRKIEEDLFAGRLRAIVSTNALELGIDVGSLDAAILVGYPGTIASTWQQMGRAGRRQTPSLAIMVANNDPIDQFMLRHPDYFFGQTAEQATLDSGNPYILARHLSCAAFELPISADDTQRFGPRTPAIASHLRDGGYLSEAGGQFFWAKPDNPAVGISLRHMSDNTYTITERTAKGNNVIANVDFISAPELVYPEAVYLHAAETFLVRELDLVGKVAYVERLDTDYYTQAILESRILLKERRIERSFFDGQSGFGTVDVAWKTVAFKKIKFDTRENIGYGPVNIPEQTLPTTACWLSAGASEVAGLAARNLQIAEALSGIRNLIVSALPMLAMCDPRDISGCLDSSNLGRLAMFVYDRYPSGLGYSERGFQDIDKLLEICHRMVADCPCQGGCPSCVGLPNLRPAIHSDPDLTRGYPIPDKKATRILLEMWTQKSPF